jgi:hypothetical protein
VDGGSQSGGGLARLIATASLFVLTGVMLLPTGAAAEATGSITGEVTSAAGGALEGNVCAISSSGEENCASTQPAGQYTISGLTSGEYKVSFTAVCVGKQCSVIYARLYYKDELSLAQADPVQVSAPATTTGIDASMETEGERKGREYLEDEVPAEPTGEATGVLPGAIEPLLVNKQIEEEFFAHPPWDQGPIPSRLSSTGAVATLVEGVAVAASTATVKHATAKIVLHCTGAGACGGLVKLVEGVTKKHFAKRVSVMHTRKLVIGTAGFSLRAGASETLHVHLTDIGRTLFSRAGKKMLKVKLTGSGVKSGALILK